MEMKMKMMKKGEMLSKAILIATLAHEGQFDKGGNPYILHPLTVLHKLKSKDEDEQAAAVLQKAQNRQQSQVRHLHRKQPQSQR